AACGSVAEAVRRAKAAAGHLMKVEVEIDNLGQLGAAPLPPPGVRVLGKFGQREDAPRPQPDVLMLATFGLADLAEAVRQTAGRAVLEASGGVTLETVRAIAETGVDVIRVGGLTPSAS